MGSDGMGRSCGWCFGPIAARARRDAIYCSKPCRQAAHRFGRGCVARAPATEPARIAYADPPYPGKAAYYRGHADYAGEVDHRELLARLEGFDGWALSTSSEALPGLLAEAVARGLRDVRVASWVRGARMQAAGAARSPLRSWEPVLYRRARPRDASREPVVDSLVYAAGARLTDPGRVIGAKPAAFVWWVFELVAALPGDELEDLFPGSGGFGRAWELYSTGRAAPARRVVGDRRDGSRRDLETGRAA